VGALWGALVIIAIPQLIALLRDHLPAALASTAGLEAMRFGMVLVAVVLWRPQGLAGR
jgi:branched-chain amino acid transport system permease protein